MEAVSCCLYPTKGTRSVYFPQRCTNEKGLLGYCGESNKNVIIALQVETADCIKNIDEILKTFKLSSEKILPTITHKPQFK